MTEKTEDKSAMEALDNALATDAAEEQPGIDSGLDMPPGFTQSPTSDEEDADEKAWAKFVRTNYAWCLLGIVLTPIAILVRTGRWSMRTIWQHHVGGEFGGW